MASNQYHVDLVARTVFCTGPDGQVTDLNADWEPIPDLEALRLFLLQLATMAECVAIGDGIPIIRAYETAISRQ